MRGALDSGVEGGACEVATEARPRVAAGKDVRAAAARRALLERTEADIMCCICSRSIEYVWKVGGREASCGAVVVGYIEPNSLVPDDDDI